MRRVAALEKESDSMDDPLAYFRIAERTESFDILGPLHPLINQISVPADFDVSLLLGDSGTNSRNERQCQQLQNTTIDSR